MCFYWLTALFPASQLVIRSHVRGLKHRDWLLHVPGIVHTALCHGLNIIKTEFRSASKDSKVQINLDQMV